MTVLGRTLWDRGATFEEIAEDYFGSAFGEGADEARCYLASVSEMINPKLIRGEATDAESQSARFKLTRVPDLVAAVKPAVDRGLKDGSPARAASWRYLELHGEFVCLFAEALAAKLGESEEATKERAWKLFQWVRDHEMDYQPLFDIFEFQLTLAPVFGIPRNEATA